MPDSLETQLTDGIMKGWGSTVVIWERAVTFAAGVRHRYRRPQSLALCCCVAIACKGFWELCQTPKPQEESLLHLQFFLFSFCTQAFGDTHTHTQAYAKHAPTPRAQAPASFSLTVYSDGIYPSVWVKFNNTSNDLTAACTVVSRHWALSVLSLPTVLNGVTPLL